MFLECYPNSGLRFTRFHTVPEVSLRIPNGAPAEVDGSHCEWSMILLEFANQVALVASPALNSLLSMLGRSITRCVCRTQMAREWSQSLRSSTVAVCPGSLWNCAAMLPRVVRPKAYYVVVILGARARRGSGGGSVRPRRVRTTLVCVGIGKSVATNVGFRLRADTNPMETGGGVGFASLQTKPCESRGSASCPRWSCPSSGRR